MNILEDSPVEALAFNYLSFSFLTLLNNLWTWLAVSFWKIRHPKSQLLPSSDEPISDTPGPVPEVSENDEVSVSACVPTLVGNGAVNVVDGVTKGKFTLYYQVDKVCDGVKTLMEELEEREERWEWWESWENLLKLRIGENENGWYTCQDLTAINGNVVRFWDESRESSSCLQLW